VFPHSLAAPELAERSFLRISDVHHDVRPLSQWGKRDSPIVGRITDAAQISRRETAPRRSSGSAAPPNGP